MGTINTGVGLISGIDTASLIDSLITLQSRGKVTLQTQLANLQTQQTALLDVNARLLSLMGLAESFRQNNLFRAANATSGNEETITASAATGAQPGSFQFIVKQLVSTSQKLSRGFADRDTTPLGLSSLSFELGQGGLSVDTDLETLNGGAGVQRGTIIINDRNGDESTIDLTDVTTLDEVIERINDGTAAGVTASVEGDHLLLLDSTGAGTLTITNGAESTTANDLGIAGDDGASGTLTGTNINVLGSATTLGSLNDGTGVLIRDNVTDFTIRARDGATTYDIDLGRVDIPIDADTSLSVLNNGAGITLNDDTDEPDLRIVDRDGTEYEIELTGATTVGDVQSRISSGTGGRISFGIVSGSRFSITDANPGAGTGPLQVTGIGENGTDTAEDLGILNETGVTANSFEGSLIASSVDIPQATTLAEVIDRINEQTGGHVTASIAADGVSLQLEDTVGGASNLIVQSTIANPHAAGDLGIETDVAGVANDILDGDRLIAGLGSVLVNRLHGGAGLGLPTPGAPAPLGNPTLLTELFGATGLNTNGDPGSYDVRFRDRDGTNHDIEFDGLTTVQDLIDAISSGSGGLITASIEGQSLRITDNTGGTGDFRIRDRNGSNAADQLGIEIDDPVDSTLSVDTMPVYAGSVDLQLTDRLGTTTGIDVSGAESVQDIIDLINGSGANVIASLNRAGNGLAITDTSGGTGNLVVSGVPATALGIDADIAADRVEGDNLQHGYVSESSALADLNYGRGIKNGTFRITDGLGNSANVSINSSARTLYDVITNINSRGLALQARINDTGDGLVLEHDLEVGQSAVTAIKVEGSGGSTGGDLNLIGTATSVNASLDGSYEHQIDVTVSDSLEDIVTKISDAGIPVSAAIIDTGSGAQRYRLSLTSEVTGRRGELTVDTGGVDLGLSSLSRGADAKVFFGSADPAQALLLRSGSNTITEVVPGLTLDLHKTDDEPVTVTVTRDVGSIEEAVTDFVDGFNTVLETIDGYDFYDSEAEQRGILLGSPITERVRQNLFRTVQQRAEGVTGTFQFLSEVGIRLGAGGKLELDMEKFRDAYANDPRAVEKLFAEFESSSDSVREIAPGVTVQESSENVTVRGFGDIFADMAEGLTDSVDGTLTTFTDGIDDRIALLNKRIEEFDERLENRRERLQAQFTAMEIALAGLQGQSSALQSIGANVALAASQFSQG